MTLLCWKTATTARARTPHRRLHAQLREHRRQPTSVRFSYRLLRTGRHALRLFMRGGPSRCVGLGSSQRLSQVSAPRRPSCVLFFGYQCGVTSLPILRSPACTDTPRLCYRCLHHAHTNSALVMHLSTSFCAALYVLIDPHRVLARSSRPISAVAPGGTPPVPVAVRVRLTTPVRWNGPR